jgi:hypothetical protein
MKATTDMSIIKAMIARGEKAMLAFWALVASSE